MESKHLSVCKDFIVATSRFGELTYPARLVTLSMTKVTEVPQVAGRKQGTEVAQISSSLC